MAHEAAARVSGRRHRDGVALSEGQGPDAEFVRRTDRMRAALRERGLAAAVVTRPENIYYLSNFRASAIAAWSSSSPSEARSGARRSAASSCPRHM